MQINKVMLIMPNFNWRVKMDFKKDPPMGLLYIASSLEHSGYKVNVVDAHAEDLSISDVIKRAHEFSPDVIGISCNYAPLHNINKDLCDEIKKERKGIITVVGGNHATAAYDLLLNESRSIDYIIMGQGEYIFPKLLQNISSGLPITNVRGIAYLSDGIITKNQPEPVISNLDELPMPSYHLVNMLLYDRYNIITSRGCPYRCNYCASNVITRGKVYYRGIRAIIHEIKYLYNRYGKKQIWFSDDTFTSNKVFADKLMDALTDLGGIEWSCLTRVNTVDSNLLTKMKRAGCKYISYGVESADPDMLNDMNKGITMDTVREAITNTKQSGLDMYLFFIVGYPGDTEEKVERDFDLVREICPTGVGFNIFVPLPGSKIWDELVSTGKLEPSAMNWDHLFARVGYNEYDDYSANLDEQWCSITSKKIVELCKYGESLCSI